MAQNNASKSLFTVLDEKIDEYQEKQKAKKQQEKMQGGDKNSLF